jgi:outer membrane protein W
MKWKLLVSVLAFAAFFAASAKAQDDAKIDIFAGYSYVRANPSSAGDGGFSLNGGSASVAYKATPWLSAVADFGGYTNLNLFNAGNSGTASTYLFGPRVYLRHIWRIHPFAEALFGVAHGSADLFGTTNSHNAFSAALGGGFDYRISHHFSLRPLDVEYLPTRFPEVAAGRQTQNNLRASTGIVFHF